jgi:hypothetical protein
MSGGEKSLEWPNKNGEGGKRLHNIFRLTGNFVALRKMAPSRANRFEGKPIIIQTGLFTLKLFFFLILN